MARHPLDPNDLTTDQKIYAIWLATPKKDREIKTKTGMARKLGFSRMALTRWERKDGWWEYIDSLGVGRLRRRMNDIYDALADKAETGDVPAIKLARDIVHDEVNKKTVEHQGNAEATGEKRSDEDLAEAVHKLLTKTTLGKEKIPDREEFVRMMTDRGEQTKTLGAKTK